MGYSVASFKSVAGFSLVIALSSTTEAAYVSCQADNAYTGRGWLPKVFQIEIASDRQKAEVIEPKREQFGLIPFETGLIGSSFWARGKGKVTGRGSDRGQTYNYTLQLDFYEGDTRAKAVMAMQGYHDVIQTYRCKSSMPSTSNIQSSQTPIQGGKSSFADLWQKNGGAILGQNAVPPAGSPVTKTAPPSSKAIAERPEIIQLDPRVEGKNGFVQFSVTNPETVAQVYVGDTDVSAQRPNFLWSGYIPIGESTIEIRVVGKNGVTVSKTVTLSRSNEPVMAKRDLPPIDPTAGYRAKPNPKTLAIIVGVEDYETISPATYAERDASLFFDIAQEKFGVTPENIKLLLGKKATRLNLLEAIRDWAKYKNASGTADIIVFYAGHGRTDDDGKNAYLLPFNVRASLIEESSIGLTQALETLADSTEGRVIAFIDACYSGGSRTGESLVAGRPLIVVQKQRLTRPNITLFSASSEKQIAKVLDEVRHGAFSYALMRGLTGNSDKDGDGRVTATELSDFITELVIRNVKNQTPEVSGASWSLNVK